MDAEDRKGIIVVASALALNAILRRGAPTPDGNNTLPSPDGAANMAAAYGIALAMRLEAEWPSDS